MTEVWMVVTVLDPTRVVPAVSVQGTVTTVETVMIVTGTVGAGAAGAMDEAATVVAGIAPLLLEAGIGAREDGAGVMIDDADATELASVATEAGVDTTELTGTDATELAGTDATELADVATEAGADAAEETVTGIAVVTGIKDVVTRAGQLVTVSAQLVIVISTVLKSVKVTYEATAELTEEAGIAPLLLEATGAEEAGIADVAGAAPGGHRETVDGTAVIMPGFWGTYGAQIPTR